MRLRFAFRPSGSFAEPEPRRRKPSGCGPQCLTGSAFARSASRGWRLFPLALLLALAACRPAERQWEPGGERPADVLDRETMISVFTDLHLAEGDALERALSPERSDSLLAVHYARIAREHGTDLGTIHRSYLWYVARPLTMKELYAEVIERLNRLQGEWQADPSAMP